VAKYTKFDLQIISDDENIIKKLSKFCKKQGWTFCLSENN
jgi:hypothetical protein